MAEDFGGLNPTRTLQRVLESLGYRLEGLPSGRRVPGADFWVHTPGFPPRALPVFSSLAEGSRPPEAPGSLASRWAAGVREARPEPPWGTILVVEGEENARRLGEDLSRTSPEPDPLAPFFARILIRDPSALEGQKVSWRWARRKVNGRELLTLATGTLVGLAQRSLAESPEEGFNVDLVGMLRELKGTLLVDLEGSLGVESTEDALFLLYQLAQRYGYAPGAQGGDLHELLVRAQGPASRLPWFAF